MRVLWTHNFSPTTLNAGCFMYTALAGLRALGVHVHLALHGLSFVMAGFVIIMHRKNIGRLMRGEEKRLGSK